MRIHSPRELQVTLSGAVHSLELELFGCCLDGSRLVCHFLNVGSLLPCHALKTVFWEVLGLLVSDFARFSLIPRFLPFVVGLMVVSWLDRQFIDARVYKRLSSRPLWTLECSLNWPFWQFRPLLLHSFEILSKVGLLRIFNILSRVCDVVYNRVYLFLR